MAPAVSATLFNNPVEVQTGPAQTCFNDDIVLCCSSNVSGFRVRTQSEFESILNSGLGRAFNQGYHQGGTRGVPGVMVSFCLSHPSLCLLPQTAQRPAHRLALHPLTQVSSNLVGANSNMGVQRGHSPPAPPDAHPCGCMHARAGCRDLTPGGTCMSNPVACAFDSYVEVCRKTCGKCGRFHSPVKIKRFSRPEA